MTASPVGLTMRDPARLSIGSEVRIGQKFQSVPKFYSDQKFPSVVSLLSAAFAPVGGFRSSWWFSVGPQINPVTRTPHIIVITPTEMLRERAIANAMGSGPAREHQ